MKKNFEKTGRTILAGLAAASLCLVNVRAEEPEENTGAAEITAEEKNANDGKEETVYVITDASGKNSSVIVSDWLKNSSGKKTIDDASFLEDITNVAGEESFTKNADGTITWNADGSDIYYQGTTTKQLPVDMKISYTLDGKAISAEELAGKSGHVVIRFDYTNNTGEEKTINGKTRTVKVPFAMVTGLELNEGKFSNITASNGKVISEGKRAFVVGMAFPGLSESLSLSDNSDLLSLNLP
jgi:putative membrane protein